MFTGIIQALGTIVDAERIDAEHGGDLRLSIDTGDLSLDDVQLGDSIAVNGVCLTAVELPGKGFVADVSVETLDMTATGALQAGQRVNLEKALAATARLGGHIVSGHVDGVGEVVGRYGDARSERFRIKVPVSLARYIAHKGSVTVDGTSLTVNRVEGDEFEINIVPHTIKHTIIGDYQVGTQVNLEVDIIARYLERLLLGDKAADPTVDSLS